VLVIEDNLCNNCCNISLNSTYRDFLYKWTSSNIQGARQTKIEGNTKKNTTPILSCKEVVAPCSSFKIKKWSSPSLWRNQGSLFGHTLSPLPLINSPPFSPSANRSSLSHPNNLTHWNSSSPALFPLTGYFLSNNAATTTPKINMIALQASASTL
jgi:hypothetical protein